MKFKIDENLPIEIAGLLRKEGYDAVTVGEQGLEGRPDSQILSACQGEKRVLVTLDTDFADIRVYPPDRFAGFIVLRVRRQDKPYVLDVFRRVLRMLRSEQIDRSLWIVEEKRIRIRS